MIGSRERRFPWTTQSVRWYKDAEAYCGYYDTLARRILGGLPPDARICDMCCGVGLLAKALAPACGEVAAIDINDGIIAGLQAEIARAGIPNLRASAGDFETLPYPENPYDAMVICMFSSVDEFFPRAERWASDTLFFITNAAEKRAFSASGQPNDGREYLRSKAYLAERNIPFSVELLSMEFGQPFRSLEDAAVFIRHYDQESSDAEIQQYLSARLVPADRAPFRYYLPNNKSIAFFSIDLK